jgi:hypothetical protein
MIGCLNVPRTLSTAPTIHILAASMARKLPGSMTKRKLRYLLGAVGNEIELRGIAPLGDQRTPSLTLRLTSPPTPHVSSAHVTCSSLDSYGNCFRTSKR